ncbi:ABC transporter substrate-binding protein, partial [Nocardia puris]|nr:ABC transporter substrate-binding protein [Nocardia puris]
GWLGETAAAAGLEFGVLQDAGPELAGHHFLHDLPSLIREGGNVPALAARAQGSPPRLIGLTWIDEAQAILVGPDSPVASPAELAGLRIGVPGWAA